VTPISDDGRSVDSGRCDWLGWRARVWSDSLLSGARCVPVRVRQTFSRSEPLFGRSEVYERRMAYEISI